MYAYQCKQCRHRFEELTAMEKRDEARCPKCGGETERVWNAPGVFGVRFSSSAGEEHPCEYGGSCEGCACGRH